MTTIERAIVWAGAILLVVFAGRFGLVPQRTAEVLRLVLPVIAITAIARPCARAPHSGEMRA